MPRRTRRLQPPRYWTAKELADFNRQQARSLCRGWDHRFRPYSPGPEEWIYLLAYTNDRGRYITKAFYHKERRDQVASWLAEAGHDVEYLESSYDHPRVSFEPPQ